MRNLLAVLALLSPLTLFGQTLSPTTTIVERSLTAAATRLVAPYQKGEVVSITVEDHPDSRWIESIVLREAQGKGLDVRTSNEQTSLVVVPTDVSTRYELVDDTDSVLRIVTIDITGILQRGNVKETVVIPAVRDSTMCIRQDALAAESRQHRSTHGEMPAPESSLWDDALEPVIFIGAAVATVVLLFTVRSQ